MTLFAGCWNPLDFGMSTLRRTPSSGVCPMPRRYGRARWGAWHAALLSSTLKGQRFASKSVRRSSVMLMSILRPTVLSSQWRSRCVRDADRHPIPVVVGSQANARRFFQSALGIMSARRSVANALCGPCAASEHLLGSYSRFAKQRRVEHPLANEAAEIPPASPASARGCGTRPGRRYLPFRTSR